MVENKQLKTYDYLLFGKHYKVAPLVYHYHNNDRIAILLHDIEQDNENEDLVLTINLSDSPINDKKTCSFIDTNNLVGAIDFVLDNELGVIIDYGFSGYCCYPLVKFDLNKLNIVEKEE